MYLKTDESISCQNFTLKNHPKIRIEGRGQVTKAVPKLKSPNQSYYTREHVEYGNLSEKTAENLKTMH